MAKRVFGPYGCLDEHPSSQSVKFNGKYVNLAEVSRLKDIDHGYLSRIFKGQRVPSMTIAKKIADALHMTQEDFLSVLNLSTTESIIRKVS